MKVLVRVYSWENPKLYASEAELVRGDKVIITTEFANELGVVEVVNVDTKEEPDGRIQRLATTRDKEVFDQYEEQKEGLLSACREEIKKLNLEMKLIDARISLDGKQVIYVFTADGRVDFRELVKNLSRELKKTIRMQQIGSRDEARKLGGFGICGRKLCCVIFKGNIQSISTDMARAQQIAHRGTERISGLCGRLMCCLAFEAQQYRKMLEGMPEPYSVINTSQGKGTVIEINAITGEIKVKLENGQYLNIKKEDLK